MDAQETVTGHCRILSRGQRVAFLASAAPLPIVLPVAFISRMPKVIVELSEGYPVDDYDTLLAHLAQGWFYGRPGPVELLYLPAQATAG